MENNSTLKVPKKYQDMLKEVDFEGQNEYWLYSEDGFKFASTDSHTARAETQAEALKDIRTLKECYCIDCNSDAPFKH